MTSFPFSQQLVSSVLSVMLYVLRYSDCISSFSLPLSFPSLILLEYPHPIFRSGPLFLFDFHTGKSNTRKSVNQPVFTSCFTRFPLRYLILTLFFHSLSFFLAFLPLKQFYLFFPLTPFPQTVCLKREFVLFLTLTGYLLFPSREYTSALLSTKTKPYHITPFLYQEGEGLLTHSPIGCWLFPPAVRD